MKKLLLALVFTGCGSYETHEVGGRFRVESEGLSSVSLITDTKTGCEFVSYYKAGTALIPGTCKEAR